MIIGITGTLGAGKGTIVDYLEKKKGFKHFSVRDFLIEEIERRKLPVNRDTLTLVADDLRRNFGPSYLAEEMYKKAEKIGGNCVIESLRAIGEIEALRRKGNFILFGIDADPEIRYQRISQRSGVTDKVTYEKFISDEKREINPNDPTRGNLIGCIAISDYKFTNNKTVENLQNEIEKVLKKLFKA